MTSHFFVETHLHVFFIRLLQQGFTLEKLLFRVVNVVFVGWSEFVIEIQALAGANMGQDYLGMFFILHTEGGVVFFIILD